MLYLVPPPAGDASRALALDVTRRRGKSADIGSAHGDKDEATEEGDEEVLGVGGIEGSAQ